MVFGWTKVFIVIKGTAPLRYYYILSRFFHLVTNNVYIYRMQQQLVTKIDGEMLALERELKKIDESLVQYDNEEKKYDHKMRFYREQIHKLQHVSLHYKSH